MADWPVAAMGNQPWSRNAASKIKDLIFILRNSKLTFALHESLWRVYSCIVLLFTKNKNHDTSSLPCIFCMYLQFFSYIIWSLLLFSRTVALSRTHKVRVLARTYVQWDISVLVQKNRSINKSVREKLDNIDFFDEIYASRCFNLLRQQGINKDIV